MNVIAKTVAVLVSTAIYLGVAIVCRGGVNAFFAEPTLVAVAIATLIAAMAAPFIGGNLSPGVREDRGNRWVLPVFGLLGVLEAVLPPWADRAGVWPLDGASVRWLGALLYAVGIVVRLWPVYVLGDRFSGLVAIQPGHSLVTTGIYSVVRNPSYLGLVVATLGWGMAFNTWVGVLLAAALLPPLVARMRAEERLLREQFGEEYATYCAGTWRLMPFVF
ncbi:MAG TPA: isoprenylcysteine carboxylmethyltransferase family protein [Acetobacteraceae bacterium]|jgi:protein-S-isoprenylcysteine O-methyltransferase Ste14|nr:isoprenylcysteine carboxylmethyltransferase family protein [Acetobacteraceae bacterium]